MLIRITKTFSDSASPRPLLANELLDVPERFATTWISEGLAQAYPPDAVTTPTPPKRKRERATRI
jgi:hypothetical protein